MGASFYDLTDVRLNEDRRVSLKLTPEMMLRTVNGGYLAALGLRATASLSSAQTPVSLSMDFIRGVKIGEAILEVAPVSVKLGSTLHGVTLSQHGNLCATARIWTMNARGGPEHDSGSMPLVPHPDELRSLEQIIKPSDPPIPRFFDIFDQRPINRDSQSIKRRSSKFRRWFRMRNEPDAFDEFYGFSRCLPIIDVFGIMAGAQMYEGPFVFGFAPTANLSVHFMDTRYSGEWLLCDAVCDYAGAGAIFSRARMWGLRGELVAEGISSMVFKSKRTNRPVV